MEPTYDDIHKNLMSLLTTSNATPDEVNNILEQYKIFIAKTIENQNAIARENVQREFNHITNE
jgi:hypothetical protein